MESLTRSTADAVRVTLRRRGLTQEDAAALIGLSQAAISRRLSGEVSWRVDELERVAAALDLDVRDLIRPRVDRPMGATA